MAFSVEIDSRDNILKEEHIVYLFTGPEELDMLIANLVALKEGDIGSNILTYFSDSWGNGALSEERIIENSIITHCLKIEKIPEV